MKGKRQKSDDRSAENRFLRVEGGVPEEGKN